MKKAQKKAIAVGAGLAAVAAAAAGVYMMTGKNSKNRKKVAKWAGNMEADIVKELNKAGKASKATYHKIVDSTAKNYKKMRTVSAPELAAVASELKNSWDHISAELNKASKTVRKVVPAAAKNIAKKVSAKKVSKKTVKKATKVAKKSAKRRR